MIFYGYFGFHNYVSMKKQGKRCIAQTCAGALPRLYISVERTSKAPKFRGVKVDCKFAPRIFRALEVRPAKLWSLRSAPRGVLEQCNLCPAFSWRHSYRGHNTHKNHLKLWFVIFFKVLFCKPLSFQRSIPPIWQCLKKKIFYEMVPLNYKKMYYLGNCVC